MQCYGSMMFPSKHELKVSICHAQHRMHRSLVLQVSHTVLQFNLSPVLVCAPVKVTATVVPRSPPLAFPNDMLLMGPTVHPLLIVVLL